MHWKCIKIVKEPKTPLQTQLHRFMSVIFWFKCFKVKLLDNINIINSSLLPIFTSVGTAFSKTSTGHEYNLALQTNLMAKFLWQHTANWMLEHEEHFTIFSTAFIARELFF